MPEDSDRSNDDEELRQAYLFVNDPFHSPGQGMVLSLLLVMWAAADALVHDPGDFSPWFPAVLFLFMGPASAWARWHARKRDAAGLRRNLRRNRALFGWVLPIGRVICVAFPAVYGLLVWQRWERWKFVMGEMGVAPEDLGGWGNLLFEGTDASLVIPVVFMVWMTYRVGPRIRAVASMHIGLTPLDPPPVPDRHDAPSP